MENIKIFVDGIEKDVFGLFYIYDSKYYFIYTEKEVDENNYVILYMTSVGKETINTENGIIETGAMIGVEITNIEEQQKAQTSISYIVEDKKNNTINPKIQYLPINMITQMKVVSKKRFRLLKSIMEENFKLNFNVVSTTLEDINNSQIQTLIQEPIVVVPEIQEPIAVVPEIQEPITINEFQLPEMTQPEIVTPISEEVSNNNNVIIDYRSKYFEETEKNKELETQIEILNQKLNEIKRVID